MMMTELECDQMLKKLESTLEAIAKSNNATSHAKFKAFTACLKAYEGLEDLKQWINQPQLW